MADQKIVIDARINRKAAQADLRALKADVTATARQIASLGKQISTAQNKHLKLGDDLKTAQEAAASTQEAIQSLGKKMSLDKQYGELQGQNEALTATLGQQDQKVQRLTADYQSFLDARDKAGDNFTPEQAAASEKANADYKAQIAEAKAAADATAAQLDSVAQQMDALRSQGAGAESPADTKQMDKLNAQLEQQQAKVEQIKADYDAQGQAVAGLQSQHEALKSTLQQEQDAVEQQSVALAKMPTSTSLQSAAAPNMAARFTKAGKAANYLSHRMRRLVTSALIFNIISKALNAMVTTMGNALLKTSEFRTAFAQLKGSVATAAAGLASAIAPALTWILNLISSLINAFIQLISLITGKGIGAMKKQGQAIANTGKSAGAAANQLAKFDELDVLDKGSGSDTVAPDFSGITDETSKISDLLKDLVEKFKEGFTKGFGDAGEGLKNIKADLAKIGESLKEIWTDPAVSAAVKRWTESVAYELGALAGSVASIGISIAENLVGGMARYLERSKDFLKSILANIFNLGADLNYLFGDFAAAVAEIFRSLGSEGAKQLTSGLIGTFLNSVLGMIQTVQQVAYALEKPLFQPIIDNATQIRETLSNLFAAVAPFFVGISDGVAEFYTALGGLFNDVLRPLIDALAEFYSNTLSGLLDDANEFLDGLSGHSDTLHAIGENIGFIIGALTAGLAVFETLKTVGTLVTGVFNGISAAAGFVSTAVGFLASPFGIAVAVIAAVIAAGVLLYQNWDTVKAKAQELADKLSPIFETIKGIVEDVANAAQNVWNNYLKPVLTSAGNAVQNLWRIIQTFWNTILKPILDNIVENLQQLWENTLQPLWNHIAALVESVVGLVQTLAHWVLAIVSAIVQAVLEFWNQVLAPLINWLLATFGPVFTDIFNTVGDIVTTVATLIGDEIDIILDVLTGLITFVTDVLQGDWEGAWNTIKETFMNIWDDMKKRADDVLGGIQEFIENIIQAVKDLVGGLGELGGTVLEKVSSAWNTLTQGTPHSPYSSYSMADTGGVPVTQALAGLPIPALAQGAVIPANRKFLAVLGDQTNGTNVEAPLATIQQALAEVMEAYGGQQQDITIRFAGDLAQLARVLKPYIDKEENRRGVKLVTGGVY